MFLFKNIYTFFTNYHLKLEYDDIDYYNEEPEDVCHCNLCCFMKKYISPILFFICFELKYKSS